MNKTTKFIIVIAIVALLGGAIYYFSNKSNLLDGPTGNDPFSIDDDTYYKIARNLLPVKDRAWVDKEVAKVFGQTKAEFVTGGKPSKTLTFIEMVSMMSGNENGSYMNKDGTGKVLWPPQMLDDMWAQARNPMTAKYGGLA